MTLYNRVDAVSYKFDRWAEKNIARAAYKFVEWTPVAQGATNLGSSLTGRDMTIPEWDEGSKPGANVSGAELGLSRRVATGVNGATQFIGIGLGGAGGVASDMLLEGVADGFDMNGNQTTTIKVIKSAVDFHRNVQKNPMKSVSEVVNFGVGTTAEKVDDKLKNGE